MPRFVDAIVVNTRERSPGQMLGMGDLQSSTQSLANLLTGGDYADLSSAVESLPTLLKVSIAASVISGALAIWALVEQGARRR